MAVMPKSCQSHLRNVKRSKLAAFDKIRNVFSITYAQVIAKELSPLEVHCRHIYYAKTGHEFNCCVFISRECSISSSHVFVLCTCLHITLSWQDKLRPDTEIILHCAYSATFDRSLLRCISTELINGQ